MKTIAKLCVVEQSATNPPVPGVCAPEVDLGFRKQHTSHFRRKCPTVVRRLCTRRRTLNTETPIKGDQLMPQTTTHLSIHRHQHRGEAPCTRAGPGPPTPRCRDG